MIELLVVIVIIGILSAIAIPVFNSVRTKGVQLKCATNLKQWGAAMLAYAADNNGRVQFDGWASLGTDSSYYEKYFTGGSASSSTVLKGRKATYTEVFRLCPGQLYTGTTEDRVPVGYVVSRPNPPVTSQGYFPLSRATKPSQLVLLMDGDSMDNTLRITSSGELPTKVKPFTVPGAKLRHGGLINVLFGDGHVQGYSWSQLDPNVTNNPAQVDRLNNWFQLYP